MKERGKGKERIIIGRGKRGMKERGKGRKKL
jgi:hypothetical protein